MSGFLGEFWGYLTSRSQQLIFDSTMHASAVAQSMLLAIVIAVAIGILVYRSERLTNIAVASTSTILTFPSFALLGLLIPFLGLGVRPTVTALVLYALLPIVRNTVVGLRGVDPAMTEAAQGIGMPRWRVLALVELPLAWPAILAGIRVSTQMTMGIAALAAFAAGPGLGNQILGGLNRIGATNAVSEALAGTLGVAILAILFDIVLIIIGRLTISRGIRV
ncbi:ABC transporter permease [Fodinicola acaciae]|uniref:ABC transporter permease n=1 Tax=Fodinicola acaciae TaxID=2681555 RepID=UPI0013D6C780|nr:ABC transporter permease [Fodinicola acaciae]